jgi:hypothetical protein
MSAKWWETNTEPSSAQLALPGLLQPSLNKPLSPLISGVNVCRRIGSFPGRHGKLAHPGWQFPQLELWLYSPTNPCDPGALSA